jgi:hypothetical protein
MAKNGYKVCPDSGQHKIIRLRNNVGSVLNEKKVFLLFDLSAINSISGEENGTDS